MADELSRFLERLRQKRTATRAQLCAATAPRRAESRIDGGTFRAGGRVFDTVTGEEGEVLGGTRENVIVPTAR